MRPILSPNDLASRLGYSREQLELVASELNDERRGAHYRWGVLWESGCIVRHLRVPNRHLKEIQTRIKRQILDRLPVSESAHGSVKGRSAKSNARPHQGKRVVAKVDVRQFFARVKHEAVFALFRVEFGFGRDVCRLLTRLTTIDDQLPQGSPTSPSLANLVLATTVDGPLRAAATELGVEFTRYVDDITLSGDQPQPLIQVAARLLSRQGLRIHRSAKKLKVMPRSGAQNVTGILVNHAMLLSKPKCYRDGVRAAIASMDTLTGERRQVAERKVRGQITYVADLQPLAASRLLELLERSLGKA